MRAWGMLVAVPLVCLSNAGRADEAGDEDLPGGLIARYTVADQTAWRIEPDAQFTWGTHAPDERLPAGRFSALWSGRLLVRSDERYRFWLYLQGDAAVTLAGKVVVRGSKSEPGWAAGDEVPLESGELPLEITFRKAGEAATLRLFWSAESFPLEPVPARTLFVSSSRPDLERIARGRDLF